MNDTQQLPHGMWPSLISVDLVSLRMRLEDVQWSADGSKLVWAETRPTGTVIVAQEGQSRRDLTDKHAPRGGVGYGGGSFTVSGAPDTLVFADRDGRLYRRSLGVEPPRPITPAFNAPASGLAAPAVSPDGKWVAYIYSDGKTDLLAVVDAYGKDWPVQAARGADFYMQPAWSPGGDWLAWVEWDHPNMPWDETRVKLARFESSPPRLVDVQTISAGNTAAQQPHFSPDGRWLSFIEETGEWPELFLFDLQSGKRCSLIQADGFELALPAWVQGTRSTAWSPDSRLIYHVRYQGPTSSLWAVDVNSGQSARLNTPYTSITQLTVNSRTGETAFLGSSSTMVEQIVIMDGNETRPVAYSTAATYDPAYIPTARPIQWNTSDGQQAYGLYYAPTNPRFHGEDAPPVILHIHGGPTSIASEGFHPEKAYFTSRGYAWVEVNYRGGTGYGRTYRQSMRGRWGDVDVEDAASCARTLADQGLANPKQLVILGGSAGGYTVLNTLVRYPGLFKAGICLYGVANLFTLELETHKFEEHYNATLIGALPEAAERFAAWSPAFHADRIHDALYIFQGKEDKVVPVSQAEDIVSHLKERGVPHNYRLYEGEGHGFRKPETIADYLKETERFLQEHVLFAP